MKDRVVLLSTLTLVITVSLFVWLTWTRWGTIGIRPALGLLVLGSALLALAASGLLLASRRRAARSRQLPAGSPAATPEIEKTPACPSPEETPVAAVEMK